MKCPLLIMVQYHREGYLPDGGAACIEKECAWWDSEVQCCVIKSLRLDIDTIGEILTGIKQEIPQWRQFGK